MQRRFEELMALQQRHNMLHQLLQEQQQQQHPLMMQLLSPDEMELLHQAHVFRRQQQQMAALQQEHMQQEQIQQRAHGRHQTAVHQADAARSIAICGPMGALDVPSSLWQQQVITNAINVFKSHSERGLLDITAPTSKKTTTTIGMLGGGTSMDLSPPPAPAGCIDGHGPSLRVPPLHHNVLGRHPHSEIQASAINERVNGGGKRRRLVDDGDALFHPPSPCIARGIAAPTKSNFAAMTRNDIARLYGDINARSAMKSSDHASARDDTSPRKTEYGARAVRRASAA